MAAEDVAVFLESGLLSLLQNGELAGWLASRPTKPHCYALAEDLRIMGITAEELMAGVEIIDYAGLVQLTLENPQILSWP
jgi:tRNA 2-thiouridine synthesizing protein B